MLVYPKDHSLFCSNLLPTIWAGEQVVTDSLESWTTSLSAHVAVLVSVGQYTAAGPALRAMHTAPDLYMLLKSGKRARVLPTFVFGKAKPNVCVMEM